METVASSTKISGPLTGAGMSERTDKPLSPSLARILRGGQREIRMSKASNRRKRRANAAKYRKGLRSVSEVEHAPPMTVDLDPNLYASAWSRVEAAVCFARPSQDGEAHEDRPLTVAAIYGKTRHLAATRTPLGEREARADIAIAFGGERCDRTGAGRKEVMRSRSTLRAHSDDGGKTWAAFHKSRRALVPYARDVFGPRERKETKSKAVTSGECVTISKDEHYFDHVSERSVNV